MKAVKLFLQVVEAQNRPTINRHVADASDVHTGRSGDVSDCLGETILSAITVSQEAQGQTMCEVSPGVAVLAVSPVLSFQIQILLAAHFADGVETDLAMDPSR